jgi:hypothetical protein
MIKDEVLVEAARRLPEPIRSIAKAAFYMGRHWAHPDLKQMGTVQDLYYWASDGNLDTLLLLQNYFSALYPSLDTGTEGSISIYDRAGSLLGTRTFSLPKDACVKYRVSGLLSDFHALNRGDFGTLEVHIEIPKAVLEHIRPQKPYYFWDRFYIGYTNAKGQVCFVHGVDKTHIYRDRKSDPVDWYKTPGNHEWAPEIPVNMPEYLRFSVVMINRTSKPATITLRVADIQDQSRSWRAEVPAKGVHRFELTDQEISGLVPDELRLKIEGMATKFGRPAVFKEFRNGAISAMHC